MNLLLCAEETQPHRQRRAVCVRRSVSTLPAAYRRPRLRPSRAIAARRDKARDTPAMSRCGAHAARPHTTHVFSSECRVRTARPHGAIRGATACRARVRSQAPSSSVTQRGSADRRSGWVCAPMLPAAHDGAHRSRYARNPELTRWALECGRHSRVRHTQATVRSVGCDEVDTILIGTVALTAPSPESGRRDSIRVVAPSQPPGAGWLRSQLCGPYARRSRRGQTAGTGAHTRGFSNCLGTLPACCRRLRLRREMADACESSIAGRTRASVKPHPAVEQRTPHLSRTLTSGCASACRA